MRMPCSAFRAIPTFAASCGCHHMRQRCAEQGRARGHRSLCFTANRHALLRTLSHCLFRGLFRPCRGDDCHGLAAPYLRGGHSGPGCYPCRRGVRSGQKRGLERGGAVRGGRPVRPVVVYQYDRTRRRNGTARSDHTAAERRGSVAGMCSHGGCDQILMSKALAAGRNTCVLTSRHS